LAVAPVGSVLPAVAVLAVLEDLALVLAAAAGAAGVAVLAAAGAAAGAEVAAAAGLAPEAFCTPPWPLQVPLPVEVLVVPSAQVVEPPLAGAAGAFAGVAGAGAAAAAAAAFWIPP
jgi:hypothetical protein